jgi:hypothetical protein
MGKKIQDVKSKKIGSFSLIERVILSAGAMLIFSVSFHCHVLVGILRASVVGNLQLTKCPKAKKMCLMKDIT